MNINDFNISNNFENKEILNNSLNIQNIPVIFEKYGTNLTDLAYKGQLIECVGRENELKEIMEILVRRYKNNPILIGESGIGKKTIIELFATKIIKNLVPFILENRILISLDLTRILSGLKYKSEFDLRLQKILTTAINYPNIILFINNIHTIGNIGGNDGSSDIANILKPVFSNNNFQCIGTTTEKDYKFIQNDPVLDRKFQSIKIVEPSIDQTIKILYSLRPALETFHNIEILPGAIKLAVELTEKYIADKFLPEKAIDLIDRVAAKEVISLTSTKENTSITALINTGLKNLGILRLEAFRRGDIASEFIFQEIEIAYRKFLLQWIESPETYKDLKISFSSPLSKKLFNQMKLSILNKIDNLLLASSSPRFIQKEINIYTNFSKNKNKEIFNNFKNIINHSNKLILNFNRISIYLFTIWLQLKLNITRNNKIELYNLILTTIINKKINIFIKLKNKFINKYQDLESIIQNYKINSKLEETKLLIFKDCIKKLGPILHKGFIQSLINSSSINFSEQELIFIYLLLGHFSTKFGHNLLASLENPQLIQQARQNNNFSELKNKITQNKIRDILANITGIPIQSLSVTESQKLLNLEILLHQRVIGQEEGISAIAKAMRRARLGIQNPKRPLASFLFCGPTGVGKTEITKALAYIMYGSEKNMIRFDMSEFMEKFAISRLIGSPPGYIGYDEGGQLTNAVSQKPYSIVLFDEIEKAHPDILNILLQILEDGRLTDSKKRLVKFENTIIIMTSNAAASEIQRIIKLEEKTKKQLISNNNINKKNYFITTEYLDSYKGAIKFLESSLLKNFLSDIKHQLKIEFEKSFGTLKQYNILENKLNKTNNIDLDNKSDSLLKKTVLDRLSTIFLPEFLNRIDDIIIFKPLQPEELRKICDIMIKDISNRIKSKNIILIVEENVKNKLTKDGYNPLYGARPLRRLITKYIEDLVSEDLLKNPISKFEKKIKIILNEKNQIVIKKNI